MVLLMVGTVNGTTGTTGTGCFCLLYYWYVVSMMKEYYRVLFILLHIIIY